MENIKIDLKNKQVKVMEWCLRLMITNQTDQAQKKKTVQIIKKGMGEVA